MELLDCQVYTEHLESMGAVFLSRDGYLKRLATARHHHGLQALSAAGI